MGTPEFAVPSLRAVARGCEVAAVVTRPDRPHGRGLESGPSAVALEAGRLGLEVAKPEQPNAPASRDRLAALAPDLFAVVAFGAILGRELLATPRLGAINLHGSLLPEYRGASPVQRALWEGRAWTGVTTLWMDEGIDTGDLILQRWCPIPASADAGSLAARSPSSARRSSPRVWCSLTRGARRAGRRSAGRDRTRRSSPSATALWTGAWMRSRSGTGSAP